MDFFGSVIDVRREDFKIYYCQLICHIKLHDNGMLGKCRIFPSDQTVVETERQLKKKEIQTQIHLKETELSPGIHDLLHNPVRVIAAEVNYRYRCCRRRQAPRSFVRREHVGFRH